MGKTIKKITGLLIICSLIGIVTGYATAFGMEDYNKMWWIGFFVPHGTLIMLAVLVAVVGLLDWLLND